MKKAIAKINNLQKALKEIEERFDNVRNIREYDALQAEKTVALYDLKAAAEELARIANIKLEIQEECLSNKAQDAVADEFAKRIKKAI